MIKKFEPFEYQKQIIDHIRSNDRSAIFAFCGSGKTVATLNALKDRVILVVAPVRVCNLVWSSEASKWDFSHDWEVTNMRDAVVSGKKSVKQKAIDAWENGTSKVYTINYENLVKFTDQFIRGRKSIPVNVVVFDELSMAKNPSSKRINHFRKYARFKKRVGLTGTPTSNGYSDLFAQVRLLDEGAALGKYVTHFRNQYFFQPNRSACPYLWELQSDGRSRIEKKISPITLTLDAEKYSKVPECDVIDYDVNIPTEEYCEMEKEFILSFDDDYGTAETSAVLSQKLVQLASGYLYLDSGKVKDVHSEKLDMLRKITSANKQFLVGVAHRHQYKLITEDSKVFNEENFELWKKGEFKCLVAHPAQMAHGIDGLQHDCNDVVWVTCPWSYENYHQFNSRIARNGQKDRTTIHRIIAKDTIDEAVIECLREKLDGENHLKKALKVLERLARY